MPKKATIPNAKRVLNILPSPDTQKDWRYEDAAAAGLTDGPAAAFPPTKDLRPAGWWAIRDQGLTGACVGFATADSVLRWHFAQAGRLGKTDTARDMLTPRFTWMASKETDQYTAYPTTMVELEGTWLKAALDVSRKYGAARETDLPFHPEKLWGGSRAAFFARTAQFKIASYYNLTPLPGESDASLFNKWRDWLANHGPILTRLGVDATWDNVSSNGNLDTYQPATVRGGHAVALAGYTKDRFIVRNSWGIPWGDRGYGYASLAYARAAFTEAYGVTI
jgi:hypothetical protein